MHMFIEIPCQEPLAEIIGFPSIKTLGGGGARSYERYAAGSSKAFEAGGAPLGAGAGCPSPHAN